jgi:hypothetical protein
MRRFLEERPMESMDVYVGTKIVRAEPMTREQFEADHRSLSERLTDKEIIHEGYLVKYSDGYNWLPKRVFEDMYRPLSPSERRFCRRGTDGPGE